MRAAEPDSTAEGGRSSDGAAPAPRSLAQAALHQRRPTIRDVAREAGVAIGTVSDAINGKGRVDPKTRTRVRDVAHRLGYQANRHARGLRSGRSRALGLMLPVRGAPHADEALSLDFYMRLASSAAASAFTHQQALMLLSPKLGSSYLLGLGLDAGIVVDPKARDPRVTLFEEFGIPVVTIERELGRKDGWYVACRTGQITREILDHLSARGAERIALLLPRADWAWPVETLGAYDAWVSEHGFPRVVARASMRQAELHAYEAALALLGASPSPDAIVVLAARFISGVMRAAEAAGRNVPGSLMIAAGVDSLPAREGHPPVTAWDLHPERQAAEAVALVLARIAGTATSRCRYVDATPCLRASTGC